MIECEIVIKVVQVGTYENRTRLESDTWVRSSTRQQLAWMLSGARRLLDIGQLEYPYV